MKAERLALDTHVWIAALLVPTGTARNIVGLLVEHGIEIPMSEAIFAERASRDAELTVDGRPLAEGYRFASIAPQSEARIHRRGLRGRCERGGTTGSKPRPRPSPACRRLRAAG
ncbi:MAG: hypothetical protein MUF07_02645 [Steroidobacteraceae bacterium]|jgi:hypothetical protein|nr:hypothetical protein [Steroidobacteraceae bacterium]